MSKYGVFSGPYFLIYRLNTERYEENTDQKNTIFGHFLRSADFDANIQFTECQLRFTGVLLSKSVSKMVNCTYRKLINSDMYFDWDIFALVSWKKQTLKILVELVFTSLAQQINFSTRD